MAVIVPIGITVTGDAIGVLKIDGGVRQAAVAPVNFTTPITGGNVGVQYLGGDRIAILYPMGASAPATEVGQILPRGVKR